jgi:hypothetical protein
MPDELSHALDYKVVELSAVDEGSLERTINEWVRKGWAFDGVQFAMRESSKRPAMAFVFFTREGEVIVPDTASHGFRPEDEAGRHLVRLARSGDGAEPEGDAWSRLQALAGDDEP